MNKECRNAGHKPGCLNFYVIYTDGKGSDDECRVVDVRPPIGKRVTTSTRVRLEVDCDGSDTSQTETGTTDEEQGQTETDTTDNEQGQTETDTTDKKEDEKGR